MHEKEMICSSQNLFSRNDAGLNSIRKRSYIAPWMSTLVYLSQTHSLFELFSIHDINLDVSELICGTLYVTEKTATS